MFKQEVADDLHAWDVVTRESNKAGIDWAWDEPPASAAGRRRVQGTDDYVPPGLKRTNITILVESLTPESVFTAARHAPHPPPASAASQPARSGAAGQKFGAEECKLLGAAARTVKR